MSKSERFVSYKLFKMSVRNNGKVMPVAAITSDCRVTWVSTDHVTQEVREAIGDFIEDME